MDLLCYSSFNTVSFLVELSDNESPPDGFIVLPDAELIVLAVDDDE